MKKELAVAALAIAAFTAPSAASAATCVAATKTCTFTPGDDAFVTSGDTTPPITGSVSAKIGRSGIGSGIFTDIYAFIVDADGIGSGSFSTSLSGPRTNIDFLSATINGTVVPLTPNGPVEFGGISGVPIEAGALNQFVIRYRSAGLGSYGGNLTFTPDATAVVPEPATWGMMLLGFGMVGAGMRRRKSTLVAA